MTITLTQLIAQSRQRADMENSQFVTDAELTTYINSSIAELHDLLIGAYDSDYSLRSVSFTTTSGTSDYALPNGTNYSAAPSFYKLRGVDIALYGSEYVNIQAFNFNERNNNINATWNEAIRYRLVGSNITFSPAPTGTMNCRLWYLPVATKLASGGDTLDDLNQYSEYVIVDAAIKCMQKEESDVSVLMAQKAALTARITQMAQNRDAGSSESITDVYNDSLDAYLPRG